MIVGSTRVLLDTHALVWYVDGSARLPDSVRELLDDVQTTCYISTVSFWELATLTDYGRIELAPDLGSWIAQVKSRLRTLLIEDQHLAAYATLPQVKDHRDPFDRLLIAQALSEGLTLVSRDGKFAAYPGLRLQWA